MEFVEPEAEGLAEDSGDEAVTDEETDLGTDWETVPSPRFCDIPSQVETPDMVSQHRREIHTHTQFTHGQKLGGCRLCCSVWVSNQQTKQ